jgi:hypothetical protein
MKLVVNILDILEQALMSLLLGNKALVVVVVVVVVAAAAAAVVVILRSTSRSFHPSERHRAFMKGCH